MLKRVKLYTQAKKYFTCEKTKSIMRAPLLQIFYTGIQKHPEPDQISKSRLRELDTLR